MKDLKIGNPLDKGTTIGPLINARAVEKVQAHVDDATKKGAKVLIGGGSSIKDVSPKGTYFSPTVLADVPDSCAISTEETFGPVAALYRFDDEAEVITKANSVEVGLASYFYTKDVNRVHRVSEKLQVGMVAVNTGIIGQANVPFGGVKQSGFGREGGSEGINEYMVVKVSETVARCKRWIQLM